MKVVQKRCCDGKKPTVGITDDYQEGLPLKEGGIIPYLKCYGKESTPRVSMLQEILPEITIYLDTHTWVKLN